MAANQKPLETASHSKLALFLISYHPLAVVFCSFWVLRLSVIDRGVAVTQNNTCSSTSSSEHGEKEPWENGDLLFASTSHIAPVLSFPTPKISPPSSTGKKLAYPIWKLGIWVPLILARSQLQVVLYLNSHCHLVYNCRVSPDLEKKIKKNLNSASSPTLHWGLFPLMT